MILGVSLIIGSPVLPLPSMAGQGNMEVAGLSMSVGAARVNSIPWSFLSLF